VQCAAKAPHTELIDGVLAVFVVAGLFLPSVSRRDPGQMARDHGQQYVRRSLAAALSFVRAATVSVR
jgi:hypothetical protein